jgi:hypothetical protein
MLHHFNKAMSINLIDNPALKKLIASEQCADGDSHLLESFISLKSNRYLKSFRGIESFDCLGELIGVLKSL